MKTRLSPVLSRQEIHELVCCFLRDVTANLTVAARSVPIDVYVAFTPKGSEPRFAGIVEPGTRFVLADGSLPAVEGVTGIGVCLLQAASSLLDRGYGAVALLNSDSPNLPTSQLVETARVLSAPGERIVLGPASDGGYYLIGMKSIQPALFRAIEWSTAHVADQTRARAASLGLPITELTPWYDVDDAASLHRLVEDVKQRRTNKAPYAAPATTRLLESMRIAERVAPHADHAFAPLRVGQ